MGFDLLYLLFWPIFWLSFIHSMRQQFRIWNYTPFVEVTTFYLNKWMVLILSWKCTWSYIMVYFWILISIFLLVFVYTVCMHVCVLLGECACVCEFVKARLMFCVFLYYSLYMGVAYKNSVSNVHLPSFRDHLPLPPECWIYKTAMTLIWNFCVY